ncbi:cupin domain-containing protein [Pseudemcibacter aquimaris]|uniref:cupin domain-containing protein n=1 Tax=Pseudemcibacter aquimaris TaxID=2857064 RepID=UPI002010CB8A|nr:cupin domain-containing protein [Pseudemcibacter aquimaris]MCC3860305.1 cupin domain-containing protein [Pseudemcibacter aquimaris]WDU57629.1 cupin domain-containing protein [Pseudemcibacter aquimaris]
MPKAVPLLSKIPEKSEFYQKYWNKSPFIIKGGIDKTVLQELIPAEELAGLSLEEDIRSRIVMSGATPKDWTCEHGPFDEEKYSTLPEMNWSLLVQDVEKNHPPTASLLGEFAFSPSWLIDDVMVSYSVPGGGVGPHIDSYHVFLVQGQGKRSWKIGHDPIQMGEYIEDIDLKILKHEFDGDVFDVEAGDIIYIPPYFPHSGETTQESLTYSVGFLGPSLSEMMVEFGHFIEEQEKLNSRYAGAKLDEQSSGDDMSVGEVENFRNSMRDAINSEHFEAWLRSYFDDQCD